MATKLHGMLNLSKIDKNLIQTNAKSEKIIWVDILENTNGPDQYGNTHTITLYNKDTRTTTYLGNFKPQEFGKAQPATDQAKDSDDLPWDE